MLVEKSQYYPKTMRQHPRYPILIEHQFNLFPFFYLHVIVRFWEAFPSISIIYIDGDGDGNVCGIADFRHFIDCRIEYVCQRVFRSYYMGMGFYWIFSYFFPIYIGACANVFLYYLSCMCVSFTYAYCVVFFTDWLLLVWKRSRFVCAAWLVVVSGDCLLPLFLPIYMYTHPSPLFFFLRIGGQIVGRLFCSICTLPTDNFHRFHMSWTNNFDWLYLNWDYVSPDSPSFLFFFGWGGHVSNVPIVIDFIS